MLIRRYSRPRGSSRRIRQASASAQRTIRRSNEYFIPAPAFTQPTYIRRRTGRDLPARWPSWSPEITLRGGRMWERLPRVADPVQRRGQWWQQQPDQTWLKWDETAGGWEPQEFPPPPPEAGESVPQPTTHAVATGPGVPPAPAVGGSPPAAPASVTATPGYKYARGADGTWWARDESTGDLHWHDAAAGQWRRYIHDSSPAAGSGTATELDHAGFWKRTGALLIDLLLVSVVGFGLGYLLAEVTKGSAVAATPEEQASLALFFNGVGVVAQWLYFALMESSSKQATLGKMALGIRVTDLEGARIGFGKATGRYFGKYISALILFVGFLMAAWTEKKQALHDLMANTLVLQGRPSGDPGDAEG